jgi:glycosyltransferase involved in cell wall biosynthesis
VKYHNITPPRFFQGINDDVVARAEHGLKQAVRLAKGRSAFWVDSPFNGRELAGLVPGRTCEELPPFHQAEKLTATPPDARAASGLDGWGSVILCVGRVAPNKNLVRAVEAFAAFRDRFDRHARLVLAGEHTFPVYTNAVTDRITELKLQDAVTITGRVTVPQLKALYLTADAVLVTSDHEGFCVPLVEAMALGVPVVAVPNAAVPDTAGEAATFAGPDANQIAEALQGVCCDGDERERQLNAGRERYAERFSPAAIERRFVELFDAL